MTGWVHLGTRGASEPPVHFWAQLPINSYMVFWVGLLQNSQKEDSQSKSLVPTGGDFGPQGSLAVSGDILGGSQLGECVPGIQRVGARDAAKHPSRHRTASRQSAGSQ